MSRVVITCYIAGALRYQKLETIPVKLKLCNKIVSIKILNSFNKLKQSNKAKTKKNKYIVKDPRCNYMKKTYETKNRASGLKISNNNYKNNLATRVEILLKNRSKYERFGRFSARFERCGLGSLGGFFLKKNAQTAQILLQKPLISCGDF